MGVDSSLYREGPSAKAKLVQHLPEEGAFLKKAKTYHLLAVIVQIQISTVVT